jgi:hypothetical protein
MLKIWKCSTFIFLVQVVAATVYYTTHDFKIAMIVVTIQTVITFISISTLNLETFVTIALSVCAFSIITFILTSLTTFVLVIIATMILTVFIIATVIIAVLAIESFTIKNKENFWPCFIAAMPLGIGTVAGGAILLKRKGS